MKTIADWMIPLRDLPLVGMAPGAVGTPKYENYFIPDGKWPFLKKFHDHMLNDFDTFFNLKSWDQFHVLPFMGMSPVSVGWPRYENYFRINQTRKKPIFRMTLNKKVWLFRKRQKTKVKRHAPDRCPSCVDIPQSRSC